MSSPNIYYRATIKGVYTNWLGDGYGHIGNKYRKKATVFTVALVYLY